MAKYSFEFKKKIVIAYLNGEGGYEYLAKRYDIPQKCIVKRWIKAYEALGDDGLLRSRKNSEYSFEYKLHMVELYLSSEVSYQELALQEGINNPSLLVKWVNDFRIVGPDALRPRKKGRKKSVDSKKKESTAEKTVNVNPVDINAEHIKQLEQELLKLRIENAYLKELRRLRLEEEVLLRKRRESSTASEESLN